MSLPAQKEDEMEDTRKKKTKSIDIFAEDSHDELEKSDMSDQESLPYSESRKRSNSLLEAEEKKRIYHIRRSLRRCTSSSITTTNTVESAKDGATGKHENDLHVSTDASLSGEFLMTIEYDKNQMKQKKKKMTDPKAKKKKIGRPKKYQGAAIEIVADEVKSPKTNKFREEEKEIIKKIQPEVKRKKKGRPRKNILVEEIVKKESDIEKNPVKRLRGRPRKRRFEPNEKDSEGSVAQNNYMEEEEDFQNNVKIRRTLGRPKMIKSELSPNSKLTASTKNDIVEVGESSQEIIHHKGKKKKKRVTCPNCLRVFVSNGFYMHKKKCLRSVGEQNKVTMIDKNNLPDVILDAALDENMVRKQLPPRNRRPVVRLKPNQNQQDYHIDSDSSFVSSLTNDKKMPKTYTEDMTTNEAKPTSRIATIEDTSTEKKVWANNWKIYHDCKLLLSALDNPERLVNEGPGLWMLSPSNSEGDNEKSKFTNDLIQIKWNELIYSNDNSEAKFENNIPIQILTVCIASVGIAGLADEISNLSAKSVALLNANWIFSPIPKIENMEESSEQNSSKEMSLTTIMSKYNWYKISKPSTKIFDPKLSLTSKSRKTLEEAWNEHTKMLRDVVVNKLNCNPIVKVEENKKKNNNDYILNSNHIKGVIALKKTYVRIGDPRPSMNCCWCGPKLKHFLFCNTSASKHAALTLPSCAACIYLKKLGWNLQVYFKKKNDVHAQTNKHRVLDYRYTDPDGMRHRSMKSFLMMTTDTIVNAPPELNLHEPEQTAMNTDAVEVITKLVDKDEETDNDDVLPNPNIARIQNEAHVRDENVPLRLPSLTEILEEEEGLSGILKEDKLRVLQIHFGTCMDIAAQVLQSLCQGKLPRIVQFETPFFRPLSELNFISPDGGPPPTRFIGVIRIREHDYDVKSKKKSNAAEFKTKFGVEFPEFSPLTKNHNEDVDKSVQKSFIPSIASFENRIVLLRADIDHEDVAGRLYSFVYRILYGSQAAEKVRALHNTSHAFYDLAENTIDDSYSNKS